MAAVKVRNLFTTLFNAFIALLAAVGITTAARAPRATTATGATTATTAARAAGTARATGTARAARQPAVHIPGQGGWWSAERRERSLPPTIKQRIRAEAHGSSPAARHRPALDADADADSDPADPADSAGPADTASPVSTSGTAGTVSPVGTAGVSLDPVAERALSSVSV